MGLLLATQLSLGPDTGMSCMHYDLRQGRFAPQSGDLGLSGTMEEVSHSKEVVAEDLDCFVQIERGTRVFINDPASQTPSSAYTPTKPS